MINPKRLFKSASVTKVASATFADLDSLREQIAAIETRIVELENAPQEITASLSAVEAWLESAASRSIDVLRFGLAVERDWRKPVLPIHFVRGADIVVPDASNACEILLGLIALIGRDQLLRVIREKIESRMEGAVGLSLADRDRLITEARLDLVAYEMAEEAMVRHMPAAGLSVVRRRDIPGEILLAADTCLPG